MSEEHVQWKKLWACQEVLNNTFESPTTDFFKAQHCCVAFFGPAFRYLFPFSTNHHYLIFSQQSSDFAHPKTVRLFSWGSPLSNAGHPLYDIFFHYSLAFKCQRNLPQSSSNAVWQSCKNNCCDLFSTQVLCGLRNFSLCISCVDVWKGRACVGGPRTCLMVCWRVSDANFHVPEENVTFVTRILMASLQHWVLKDIIFYFSCTLFRACFGMCKYTCLLQLWH